MTFQKHSLFCPDYKFHMMMRFLIDYATECDLEVNWPLYHCKISETRVTRSSTVNSIIRYGVTLFSMFMNCYRVSIISGLQVITFFGAYLVLSEL